MKMICTMNCEAGQSQEEMDALAKFIADGIPKMYEIMKGYGEPEPIRLTVSMGM